MARNPFPIGRNSYSIGRVFFSGLQTNERLSDGNIGFIVIGGDRVDVHASSAVNEQVNGESGVMLYDVTCVTTLDIEVSLVEDEVREVVGASYDSIQADTFVQSKRE